MSVNEVKIHKAPFDLEVKGTGHPGSRTFAIGNEDHTLGNSLRHVLMQNSRVEFAGYSVPHPSEPVVHIRVQTAGDEESRPRAVDVIKEACETLIQQCELVINEVERKIPEVKQDRLEIEEHVRRNMEMDDPMDEDEVVEEEVYDEDVEY
jgi:DNA-directed RNA polymerases I and III subunit RPAC2